MAGMTRSSRRARAACVLSRRMKPLCHNVGKTEGVRQTGRATMKIPIPISLFIVGVACYIIFDIIRRRMVSLRMLRLKSYVCQFDCRYSGLSRNWPGAERRREWQPQPQADLVPDALVLDHLSWPETPETGRFIAGRVINNTRHRFGTLFVVFSLCDSLGLAIGQASAQTTDLRPGHAWRFAIRVRDQRVSGIRVEGASQGEAF